MDDKGIRKFFDLLLEEEEELIDPCVSCLYFDCKKNEINKTLKKKFQEPSLVNYEWCLKEKERQLKEIRKLLKIKEFKELRKEMRRGMKEIQKQTEIVMEN